MDMCMDMCIEMCIDMRRDMCEDLCIVICIDMRRDMCMDMLARPDVCEFANRRECCQQLRGPGIAVGATDM